MNCDFQFAKDEGSKELLRRFGAMLDISEALKNSWPEGVSEAVESLRSELAELEAFAGGLPALKESHFDLQLENVRFTLERIEARKEAPEIPDSLGFQLPCFLRELREELYFHAFVQPYPERREVYYREEFAAHHKNEYVAQGKTRFEVSVFVPAKDQLSYTRQCVESILRQTDKEAISFELILINHGSQDGTQAYFESVPGAKILQFKHNVRMLMFSAAARVCEGRYMAFVSNDTIVTPRWLELLLGCIRANPAVVSATPVTPNISNFQSVPAPYTNMAELLDFAEQFNQPDSAKWDRRARILPVIALYDLEKVNAIGFADRYFSTMEFWDDDFSLRARRTGYAQILCKDVYCHHYGSVTGKEAQVKENTLGRGRALFLSKHGADPWQNGAYYDYFVCDRFQKLSPPQGSEAEILGLDCGFGDTPLQIANLLRQKGVTARIDNVTLQSEYADDLRTLSRTFHLAGQESGLLDWLKGAGQYDYIYLSRPLETYADWKTLLTRLAGRLKPGGFLIFCVSNALDHANFRWFGALTFPTGKDRVCYLDPQRVSEHLASLALESEWVRKRGGANEGMLSLLAKQAAVSPLPEEERAALMDTTAFVYFARA